MTRIFLSGSRSIKSIHPTIQDRLNNLIDNNYSVLIGDANGADKAFQKFFAEKKYSNVIIYHVNESPRNNIGKWNSIEIPSDSNYRGREKFELKDIAMANSADFGIVLWDGKSVGSAKNIANLVAMEKYAVVFISKDKSALNIKNRQDLYTLINNYLEKSGAERKSEIFSSMEKQPRSLARAQLKLI